MVSTLKYSVRAFEVSCTVTQITFTHNHISLDFCCMVGDISTFQSFFYFFTLMRIFFHNEFHHSSRLQSLSFFRKYLFFEANLHSKCNSPTVLVSHIELFSIKSNTQYFCDTSVTLLLYYFDFHFLIDDRRWLY